MLPSGPVVDATGPGGAAVSFTATATDGIDPSPAVVCTPASGSVFPIGATAVTCTATDAAGNTAPGAFQVSVRGADAQLDALRGVVADLGAPGKSFEAQLASESCAGLTAFENHVDAQAGKQLTHGQAVVDHRRRPDPRRARLPYLTPQTGCGRLNGTMMARGTGSFSTPATRLVVVTITILPL